VPVPILSPTAARQAATRGSLGRILLVDDESMIREVVTHFLEDAGYQVLTAADGVEALALLDPASPVDALITDLSMPRMDGLVLIRAAQERFPSLPAVLLTGYAGDDAALALGISTTGTISLLRKPVGEVELLDRLSAMLALQRHQHEGRTVAVSISAP
jgi:CheY-like chemotaxis protein